MSKKEDKFAYRVETFSFVQRKLFVSTLVRKKNLIAKILWRRERACGRVFEILSVVVALLLSFSLHYNILRRSRRRSRRRRRANLYPLVSSRNYRTERSFFLKSISEERERDRDRERRQRVYLARNKTTRA